MLAPNGLLAAVAVVTAVGASDAAVSSRLAFPAREDFLPAAITVVSLAVASWTLGRGLSLLRRIDR